jgi:hypothetical protein
MIAEKENGTTKYKTTNPTVQETDQGGESTMHLHPNLQKSSKHPRAAARGYHGTRPSTPQAHPKPLPLLDPQDS